MLITEKHVRDAQQWGAWLHHQMEMRECGVSNDICIRVAELVKEHKGNFNDKNQDVIAAVDEYNEYMQLLHDSEAMGDKFRQQKAMTLLHEVASRNSWTEDKPIGIYDLMDVVTPGAFPYPNTRLGHVRLRASACRQSPRPLCEA